MSDYWTPDEREAWESGQTIVEGRFTAGRTSPDGYLYSLARFSVARYLKGDGPDELWVDTAYEETSEHNPNLGTGYYTPRPGEAWQLIGAFHEGASDRFSTNRCNNSRQIGHDVPVACPRGVPEDAFADVPPWVIHESRVNCASWWGLVRGTTNTSFSPGAAMTRAQMASILAALLESGAVSLPARPGDYFVDDDGNPHEYRINQLAEVGVVAGTGSSRYGPGLSVTRAQMASLLVRAYEAATARSLPAGADAFDDDNGTVHEPAIDKAAAAGFVSGRGERRYEPNGTVRRDQAAAFVVRVADTFVTEGHATTPT
jgi:hypothetical protein